VTAQIKSNNTKALRQGSLRRPSDRMLRPSMYQKKCWRILWALIGDMEL
jgi:hypothetical protein